MNYELAAILITVVIQALYIAYKIGKFDEKLINVCDKLAHLEQKQDKHNNVIERMVIVEQSTKSAHKRLDAMEQK